MTHHEPYELKQLLLKPSKDNDQITIPGVNLTKGSEKGSLSLKCHAN